MLLTLVILPFLSGVICFFIPGDEIRRKILLWSIILYNVFIALICLGCVDLENNDWVFLDSINVLFLVSTGIILLVSSFHIINYLKIEARTKKKVDIEESQIFVNTSESIFTGCLLLFTSFLTLLIVSHHLILLWVAMEATTLISAPLVYFHKHHTSLEATWKYLLICSVGIALALLGNLFLVVSSSFGAGSGWHASLVLTQLINNAAYLNPAWLKVAFIFILVGYGTKMGLVPFHTWLPDVYGSAPTAVSALFSGVFLNCAFLGILRIQQVCIAGGIGEFSRSILLFFGIISILTSVFFILGQSDYKRMLAYSSIENMGVLAFGLGIGGVSAFFGILLHCLNHSFAKTSLFFTVGNILRIYKTKNMGSIKGIINSTPLLGALWLIGFFCIAGLPPFGIFLSKFYILKGSFEQGSILMGVLFIVFLGLIFISMALKILPMVKGKPVDNFSPCVDNNYFVMLVPSIILCLFTLSLGLYIPQFLKDLLQSAFVCGRF